MKSDQIVKATVRGFLPGRRVVLDVCGDTVVAWSDLPLTRDRVLYAVLESAGAGVRLRVIEDRPADRPGLTALRERSSGRPDELDVAIADTAADLGIPPTEDLLFEIRKRLQKLERGLEKHAVPLRSLEREIRSLLMLHVRGLAPSARVRWALNTGGEARLGTVLVRLSEDLESAARAFGGAIGKALAQHAAGVGRFFVDLEEEALGPVLAEAVRRCGYFLEKEMSARGITDWETAETVGDNLKAELLWLWSSLNEMKDLRVPRSGEAARRRVERSLAWCGRALDIIEGIQIRNLPGRQESEMEPDVTFELPVTWRSLQGTMVLSRTEGKNRFWVDFMGREPFGAAVPGVGDGAAVPGVGDGAAVPGVGDGAAVLDVRNAHVTRDREGQEITLYLPESLEKRVGSRKSAWREAVSKQTGSPPETIRFRLVQDSRRVSIQMDERESREGEVDIVL